MARPVNEGLSYFPLDNDIWDDPKILIIEEKYGLKGGYIAVRLLSWIYRNGYYCEWNDGMALAFAKRVGSDVKGALVKEVVMGLVECGFFDKTVFDSFRILTSRGIQSRWSLITKKAKRIGKIKPEYNLISSEETMENEEEMQNFQSLNSTLISDDGTDNKIINSDIQGVSSEETIRSTEETCSNLQVSTQRKEKKNKEKNIREDSEAAKTARKPNQYFLELLEIFKSEYKESRGFDFDTGSVNKELAAIGKLSQGFREKNPNTDTAGAKDFFRGYFKKCLSIEDNFLKKAMSPSLILNQKHQINAIIQGGTNGQKRNQPKIANLGFMGI